MPEPATGPPFEALDEDEWRDCGHVVECVVCLAVFGSNDSAAIDEWVRDHACPE